MKNNVINICFASDDNYSKYMGVSIASILANAALQDKINIYILASNISQDNVLKILSLKSIKDCNIHFLEIDENLFSDYTNIKTHNYLSLCAYYRLKMPSLLPDISKIIYFDCDVIVNSSLNELYGTNIDNCLLAGVKDINKRMLKKNPNYVNSGVLLMNLDLWREYNLEDRLLEYTKTHADTIKMGDQEILNECCKDKIKILDDTWNVQSSNFTNRSSYIRYPNIVHFVARKKPWHYASFSYHRDLYFKYLQLTPWKLDEKEYIHWTKDNQRASIIAYLQYRPLFFLRPNFYKALINTYIIKH